MFTALRSLAARVVPVVFLLSLTAVGQTNEHGIDPANFDTTCQPCDDFFQFANGTWIVNNPIPAEYSGWSTTHEVYERNLKILREILESAAANTSAAPGSDEQKIGDFYASAMDTVRIESERLAPLAEDFARIDGLSDVDGIQALIADYHKEGLPLVFDQGVFEDMLDNSEMIFYAVQGGLGLPDRDYYLRDDDESKELRDKYVRHVANMFVLLGDDSAAADKEAATVLAMETRLAKASMTNVEMNDPANYYNRIPVTEADTKTPNFSWTTYFDGLGLTGMQSFSYAQPDFFAEMNSMLTEVPVSDWKNYFRWHLINGFSNYLSTDIYNESFDFYSRTLAGTQEPRARWKRVLTATNSALGEVLGRKYVEVAFPPRAKEKAIEMILNLKAALADRIKHVSWMSDETRAKALDKLAAMTYKIGYPDEWRDYSALSIERGSYVDNVRRANAFETQRNLDKVGKAPDPNEWHMNPQTVNAYYTPLKNEIVFPAAILQPPGFDPDIDDAINYGAMGAVIGHEMTHGFDDSGAKFDADGNMVNWWTDDDKAEFERRSKMLIDQFNGYQVADGASVNGEFTLGENIADLGGLLVAYDALKKAREGKEDPMVDGFTQDQRFFLSFAQDWRANYRPEVQKLLVNTDPHSPNKFRANGPLSDMPAFREAFNCHDGDPMVRPDSLRPVIW